MAQYCRYCQHCFASNGGWCEEREIELTEAQCKHTNNCKFFELNPIDALMKNDEGYKPTGIRIEKPKRNYEQISVDSLLNGGRKSDRKYRGKGKGISEA